MFSFAEESTTKCGLQMYLEAVMYLRDFDAMLSSASKEFKHEFDIVSSHFLKTRSLADLFKVRENVFLCLLSQRRCRMHICCIKDTGRVFLANGLQHALFAHGLQAWNTKQVGRFKEFHRATQGNAQLICVQVLENGQEST